MLKNEVICVRLYQSKWGARKADKEVSKDAIERHDAASDAGSFNKKLSAASFLSGINSAFDALERLHKDKTVTWDDDGWRLLPNAQYFEYMNGIDERRNEIKHQVDLVVAGWPEFIENEQRRLKRMFKLSDYPRQDEIAGRYGVKVKRRILQTGDDVRLADHDKIEAELREEIMAETDENNQRALKDLWGRLYEPVKRLADKMQEPDLRAQKSLVTNIYDIVQVLPSLNVIGDKELENMYNDVSNRLCKHSVNKLKVDEDAHAETKVAVDEIVKKMEAYLL